METKAADKAVNQQQQLAQVPRHSQNALLKLFCQRVLELERDFGPTYDNTGFYRSFLSRQASPLIHVLSKRSLCDAASARRSMRTSARRALSSFAMW
jgi:hypothetical protein